MTDQPQPGTSGHATQPGRELTPEERAHLGLPPADSTPDQED